MICEQFCTNECTNGNCPIALSEEYGERGMDVIKSCNQCTYHTSCDDCDWNGTDICRYTKNGKEHIKDSTELSGGVYW